MGIFDFLKKNILPIVACLLIFVSFRLTAASLEKGSLLPSLGANLIGRVVAPIEKARNDVIQSVHSAWSHYVALMNVEEERDNLLRQNKKLEEKIARFTEFEHENTRLRGLLNFGKTAGFKSVGAAVIGLNSSSWVKSITLDKGEKHGIRQGYPVVDGHAIVGQVIATTPSTSTVLLLIDSTSGIDSVIQSNRTAGTVEGMGTSRLSMRYVVKNSVVKPGDKVVTSGLDGVYPKGRLIGTVVRVEDAQDMFMRIEVEPGMDLFRLEEVLVLIPEE